MVNNNNNNIIKKDIVIAINIKITSNASTPLNKSKKMKLLFVFFLPISKISFILFNSFKSKNIARKKKYNITIHNTIAKTQKNSIITPTFYLKRVITHT